MDRPKTDLRSLMFHYPQKVSKKCRKKVSRIGHFLLPLFTNQWTRTRTVRKPADVCIRHSMLVLELRDLRIRMLASRIGVHPFRPQEHGNLGNCEYVVVDPKG